MKTNNLINQLYKKIEEIKNLDSDDVDFLLQIKYDENFDKEEELNLVRIERKIFSLMFEKGELIHRFFSNQIIFENLFNEEDVNYLIKREQSIQNIFVKVRYLYVLWKVTKNQTHAKKIINILIELLEIQFRKDNIGFSKLTELMDLLDCYKYITESIKYKRDDYINNVIKVKKYIQSIYDFSQLVNHLSNNKLINFDSLKNLLLDYKKYILFDNAVNYFINDDVLNKLIPIFQKINYSQNDIYALLAENQNMLIEHRGKDDFVKLDNLRKKAYYLKLAGKITEQQKTLKELTQCKFKINLSKVNFQLSSEKEKYLEYYWRYIEKKSNFISSLNSEYILGYFSTHNDSLYTIETEKGGTSLFDNDTFTKILIDINNNTKEKDKKNSKLPENIGFFYSLFFIPIFEQSLHKAILNGNINYQNFNDFFKRTWINEKNMFSNQGVEISENWLSMLQPGLYNFFSLFEYKVLNEKLKINLFILCIDSLTLKFEGLLRDFIRFSGGSTIKLRNDNTEEILLEEMLEHDIIKQSFDVPEIELFKYTFTKQGLNIRNHVAHSFYKIIDYNFHKISLILLCILRISRYKFQSNER